MVEELVWLAVSALITLVGIAVVGWEAAAGRLFALDGLSLSLISATLAVIFGGNVAWSYHTGEIQRLLGHLGKGSETSDKNPPAAK